MHELVERARNGDHDAFGRLLADRADRLYALAYLMMRQRAAAEDALQDASLRAWHDLPRLRHVDRFDGWLRRLVINACLDALRRQRRRPSETALRPTDEPRTADATERVADRDALAQAFARLSPEHRAVIVLSHYEGMATREVASVLYVPQGTVKSRLHHALRALRAALEADARPPERATDTHP
jgi:RNA polymerase sigma-70 factor (ECF subfamily)